MSTKLSRRDFLKLAGIAGFTSVGFRPFGNSDEFVESANLGRVTIRSISVHKQPNEKSQILRQHFRDELLNLYYEIESAAGPVHNPIWYRVMGGFVHRANVLRTPIKYNDPVSTFPENGSLAEVTVPFTQAMRYSSGNQWTPIYRLYATSTHWVFGLEEGPDGKPWYKLIDELLRVEYHVPAIHLRILAPSEFEPISPDVPADQKRIEVNVTQQKVYCYEKDELVFETKVCTGVNYFPTGMIPWETPKGSFNVFSKMPSKHMGDGRLSGNPEDYELPGVPWTTFFEQSGVAFHGTYWHDDFGRRLSHGCVNMRSDEAKWLFRWATPNYEPVQMEKTGYGTRVLVYDK